MPSGRNIARTIPVAAPIGGWNARDALANMPATDAVVLDNVYPSTGSCDLRNGYTEHADGLGGEVETICVYQGDELLAAADGNIWDVTTSTPSSLGSGFTNNRWQTDNFRQRIYFMNGVDTPQVYDGSTLGNTSFSGTSNTGVTLTQANLVQPFVYKNRLYMLEKESMRVWYAGVNAVQGTVEGIDFSSVFSEGGFLAAIASWSRDAGDGADDLFVLISELGEVVVYEGDSPSSTNWAMIGRYKMGRPIGRRCWMKLGPDLLVITQNGVIPMSSVLRLGSLSSGGDSVTDKIRNAFISSALQQGSTFGWEGTYYPAGSYIFVNVPRGNGQFYQYVMNTLTGSWCRFINQNGACWTILGDFPYFGTSDGRIMMANNGENDDGDDIQFDIKWAFNYFGSPNLKKFNLVQPVFGSSNDIVFGLNVNIDFNDDIPQSEVVIATGGSLWDEVDWDIADWAGGLIIRSELYATAGIGRAGAVRVTGQVSGANISFYSINVIVEDGGYI